MYDTDLKVGEIVILKPKHRHHSHDREGFKAFIEEIIVAPTSKADLERYGSESFRTHSGVYSLYGFEPNHFFGEPDWYIGDTFGDDFERTGKMVTESDLKKLYLKVCDSEVSLSNAFKKDIVSLTKNLGRTSGRNEEEFLIADKLTV